MVTKMIIRAKSFEGWFNANLKDYKRDIAEHGANLGYPGITYYRDTVALYDKFTDEIWDALYDEAEGNGQTILELIASFNGAKDVGSDDQFKNLLVWYMCERIANKE